MSLRTAIVTGAGSGIGRTVSLALIDEGFDVVLVGRTREKLEETKSAAGENAKKAHVAVADVTSAESVEEVFQQTKTQFGRLDLLFNNAGSTWRALPSKTWMCTTGNASSTRT